MTRASLLSLLLAMALGGAAAANTVRPDATALKEAAVPFVPDAWDALLKRYVDDEGRVDYGAVDRAAFEKVYAAVAASGPRRQPDKYPTREAKEAYYLNAYNVCVWKYVLGHLPKLKNVDDAKASFFFFTKFVVGGDEINLKDLEGDVIRPQFKDGRVHMALNCASGGCPKLPRYAFAAARLDQQLDDEARRFVAEKRNVDHDATAKKVRLSRLFDWYKEDFGKEPAKVLAWINRFRAPTAQLPLDTKLEYVDYDWRLNDRSLQR
jgi:hypothetical protein